MQEWWVRLIQIPWSVLLRHVFGWIGKDVSSSWFFWKPVDLFDKGCVKENRAVFIEGINGQERPMLEKHKLLKNNIVSFQFDLDLDLQLQNFKFRKLPTSNWLSVFAQQIISGNSGWPPEEILITRIKSHWWCLVASYLSSGCVLNTFQPKTSHVYKAMCPLKPFYSQTFVVFLSRLLSFV